MNTLQERIAQFRKMASEDPENELGHFRLGQLLLEDNQAEEAAASFRRTLELSPRFSKVYQLLGSCLMKLGRRDEALQVLRQGFEVADVQGDNVPRDEMSRLLIELGESAPLSRRSEAAGPVGTGFRCQRPGCPAGSHARRLAAPPFNDPLGQRIFESICADCWDYWAHNFSIKVINEMRLDLSTERGQEVYDQVMCETLGLG